MRLYLQALTKAFYAEHNLLAIKDFNTCTQQFKPAPVMCTALDYRQILQQLHIQRIDQKHLSFNK